MTAYDKIIRFGKFSGSRVADLPQWYAVWLLNQEWPDAELKSALIQRLERFSRPHAWDRQRKTEKHCPTYWRQLSGAFAHVERIPRTCRLAARVGLTGALTYLILKQYGITGRLEHVDPYYALKNKIETISIR